MTKSNIVSGKYFGEIEFEGVISKTTVVNGKIIHTIDLSEPITAFGDSRNQILVDDDHLSVNAFHTWTW